MIHNTKEYTSAVFYREKRHRFACEVLIDENVVDCYVASSCKLSKLINLDQKNVLVKENDREKSKYDYSLFALKQDNCFVLLNLSYVNELVEKLAYAKKIDVLGHPELIIREKNFGKYRADLFIPDTKTIVEIKTVLCDRTDEIFPSVASKRIPHQLEMLYSLLSDGYNVVYLIVCLNPITRKIIINRDERFTNLYIRCTNLGMKTEACALSIDEYGDINILPVEIEEK